MEQEVNGKMYRFGKMDAVKQLHVVRRLAPALATVGVSLNKLRSAATAIDLLEPATKVISVMSDEDVEYVLFTCLRTVQRQDGAGNGKGWVAICHHSQSVLAYDDIDLPTMLQLTMLAIKENLGGFLMELTDETQSVSS